MNGRIGSFPNGGFFVGHSVYVAGQFCQWPICPTGEKDFPSPPETCKEGISLNIVEDAIPLGGPAAIKRGYSNPEGGKFMKKKKLLIGVLILSILSWGLSNCCFYPFPY